MKSLKVLILLAVLVSAGSLFADESVKVDINLHPVMTENGKYGYADDNGKIVIKPIFLVATEFKNDIAVVCVVNNKYCFINKSGKLAFKCFFENARNFSEDLAAVMITLQDKSYWGFINKRGVFEIKPEFDSVTDFNEGKATVARGKRTLKIDKAGNVVEEISLNGVHHERLN